MSDNINSMNYKQLRNEVQLLRDELAIMKRKYEDIIYNLDTDNFSSRFVKEQGDMKTAIEITAEGIKTKVSKEEMETFKESTITQTANQIKVEVEKVTTETDNKLKNYATTTWTDEQITSKVEQYVTDLVDGEYVTNTVLKSEINQTADEIYAYVSETKDDLETSISSISVTADGIESRVQDLETFKTSTFIQRGDGFTLDGAKTTFTGVIYLTDSNGENVTSIWSSSNNGRHLYMNSAYNPAGNKMDYVHIGDNIFDYDYDTGTYEDSHNVYVGQSLSDGNGNSWKVATEGWVTKKIAASGGGGGTGGYAVFG